MTRRICVVGAGQWGQNHVKTLDRLNALAGIVESDAERAQTLKGRYPDIPVYPTIKDSLNHQFDGYTLATPAATHFRLAQLLIAAGKPLLVEKPLALTAADARKLKLQAEAAGVPLMVGHVMLFHPAIQKIKTLLDAGKIGRLQYIYSNRLNLGTVRKEENILWSFAPHDVSIFQFLIGGKPIEVISRGGAFLQPGVDDTTMTIVRYPGNVAGHIFVSWLHPFKEHRMVLIGSKGMLSFEDSLENKPLFYYEKGIDWIQGEPIKHDGPTEQIEYPEEFPLTRELAYFMDHLDQPKFEIAGPDNAVEVLEILELASAEIKADEKGSIPAPKSDFFVHETARVDQPCRIGKGTKIWHYSHIQSGARIGEGCSLGQNVNVANNVVIGNQVKIQNNVSVYEGVELEDYVFCGPSMVFTNVLRPRSEFPQRGSEFYTRTLVKKSVSIGANATIVCGTTIGEYAFIGAGAVVTRDVPAFALVVGNPGKIIGWVDKQGNKLKFNQDGISACGKYKLQDNTLIQL